MGRFKEIWATRPPQVRKRARLLAAHATMDRKALTLLRQKERLSPAAAERRLKALRRGAASTLVEIATMLGLDEKTLRDARRQHPGVMICVNMWLAGQRGPPPHGVNFTSLRAEYLTAASFKKQRAAKEKERVAGAFGAGKKKGRPISRRPSVRAGVLLN